MKRLLFTSAIAAAALTLIGARHRATTPPGPPAITIDIHRSLVLTHPNDLQGFGLERVLQTLIDRSGATGTSPTTLYRQWFDTQNAKPGLVVADAPHCDDFMTDGKPSFNGFPRRCPTPEGALATTDPFAGEVAPHLRGGSAESESGGGRRRLPPRRAVLGQPVERRLGYRAQRARPALLLRRDRRLRPGAAARALRRGRGAHPHLAAGAQCSVRNRPLLPVPIAADRLAAVGGAGAAREHSLCDALQRSDQPSARRRVPPVLHLANRDAGHSRRERLLRSHPRKVPPPRDPSRGSAARLLVAGGLQPRDQHGRGRGIQRVHLRGAAAYRQLDFGQRRAGPRGHAELPRLPLRGVAVGEGVVFPFGFIGTHVDEAQQRLEDGIARFWVSRALLEVFAPHRAQILSDFLAGKPLPVHSDGSTIGGGRTSD